MENCKQSGNAPEEVKLFILQGHAKLDRPLSNRVIKNFF